MDTSADVSITDTMFADNDYGIVSLNGARVLQQDNAFVNNEKQDIHERDVVSYIPDDRVYTATEKEDDSEYNSESLLSTVVWKDKVIIKRKSPVENSTGLFSKVL